jgi:hypothetical protein
MLRKLVPVTLLIAAACCASTHAPAAEPPFRFIFEAEWNDIPCSDYPLTPERWVRECFGPLVDSQVDCLLYNLCSSDAYCCQLNSGEILCDAFDQLPDAWVWRYRENTKLLIEADANPPKLACQYGHQLGIPVIPIVRMNDCHDQYYKFELSRFKQANPHLLFGKSDKPGLESITWGMFDFGHQEVRDHKMAIIEEFITRWDNDGISLDFERHPRFFQEQGKAENAELMTGMIRDIRRLLDRVAKERGRPQYFHVRVLPTLQTSYDMGLDVRTWVEEGLVDIIVPGAGYMTVSLDLTEWLKLVEGRDCWIIASNNHWKTTEQTRAWAKLMHQRGVHGLQLFNYGHLLHGHAGQSESKSEQLGTVWLDELAPDYYQVLHELGDITTYRYKNSRYVLESFARDLRPGKPAGLNFRISHGIEALVLPIELTAGVHRLPFGFAEDVEGAVRLGQPPRVTLELTTSKHWPDEFEIRINDQPLALDVDGELPKKLSLPVPPGMIARGDNELVVDVSQIGGDDASVSQLMNVDIDVRYVYGESQLIESKPEWRETMRPLEVSLGELPVTLEVGTHEVPIELNGAWPVVAGSEAPRRGALRMSLSNYSYYDKFDVRINGELLPVEGRRTRAQFIMTNDSTIIYPLGLEELRAGENVLEIEVRQLNPAISVTPRLLTVEILVER